MMVMKLTNMVTKKLVLIQLLFQSHLVPGHQDYGHGQGQFAAVYPPSPLHLHQDDQERRHAKPAESNLLSTQLSRPPDDRLIIFILIIRVIIRNRKASKKTLQNIFGDDDYICWQTTDQVHGSNDVGGHPKVEEDHIAEQLVGKPSHPHR